MTYRPILQGHEGEIDALAEASASTWRAIEPLIELRPGRSARRSTAREACQNLRDRLMESMRAAMRLSVDASAVSDDGTLAHRGGVLLELLTEVNDLATVVPVIRPGDPAAVSDVLRFGARNGVVARIRPAQLARQGVVDELLSDVGLPRSEVDLLLDFGTVGSRTALSAAGADVLEVLEQPGWRSRTVAGGAFPKDLGKVDRWQLAEIPRREVALWSALRRAVSVDLDFGDYAVAHPVPSAGGSSPPPQLRYAVENRWLVVKGERNHPQQFFEVCRRVRAHPEFNPELGDADRAIAGRAEHGPAGGLGSGNGSTWRSLSTAHHLDFVADHLRRHERP